MRPHPSTPSSPAGGRPGSLALLALLPWLAATDVAAQEPTPSAPQAPAQPAAAPSLTLEQAIGAVLERNERGQSAWQRAQAAEARVARARAFFFPELTVSGTYTRNLYEVTRVLGDDPSAPPTVISPFNELDGAAGARLTVFDARGFPLYRAASRDRDASRAEASEVNRQLGFEAADAYLNTLAAEQVFEAAGRRLAFARSAATDARARVEAQLASSNDATRAELELASAERDATLARNQVQTAYLQLGYLLNLDVQPPLAEPAQLLADAARAHQEAHIELSPVLARRLDLKAARARVEQQEALATEPLMRLLPTLNAVAQYSLTSNTRSFQGRADTGFAALTLAWVLFDGGERYAERDERLALARAASLDTALLERTVGVQLETARVRLVNAQAAVQQAEVAASTAARNAEEAQVLYREGLTSQLQVADANIRNFEAQVALARERYGLALALLGVRAAAGLDPLGKEWNP